MIRKVWGWMMDHCSIQIDEHRQLLLHFLGQHRNVEFCNWFKSETEDMVDDTQLLYWFTRTLREHLERYGPERYANFTFNRQVKRLRIMRRIKTTEINTFDFVEVDDNRVFREFGIEKLFRVDFDLKETDGRNYDLTFLNGFELFGVALKPLGASSSLFNSRAMYFTSETNPEEMMNQFGNYDDSCVFNRVARQCLNFTSTNATIPITKFKVIDDIMTRRTNSAISDGIGRISLSTAVRVCESLRKQLGGRFIEVPRGFQIRFLGFKGMLTVCPDRMMQGQEVILRRSMKKFEANPKFNKLEIVERVNGAGNGNINRQIIILLSALGIRDNVFLSAQQDALTDQTRTVEERISRIERAKTKTKFLMKESVIARGLLDETKQLKNNQVIVFAKNGKMVEGGKKVIVFRNPSLHPKYAKIFETVFIPNYDQEWFGNTLRNPLSGSAILFASDCETNNIPGDLDGDMYFVSWNQSIIPNSEYVEGFWSTCVSWYNRLHELSKENPIEYLYTGILEYWKKKLTSSTGVFEFRMINNIGTLSNLWVKVCDMEGADSRRAKELAELFDDMMESSKTGKIVSLPEWRSEKQYAGSPNYMGGKLKSKSIIGKLFDQATALSDNTVL